jgi:hypothetical protein
VTGNVAHALDGGSQTTAGTTLISSSSLAVLTRPSVPLQRTIAPRTANLAPRGPDARPVALAAERDAGAPELSVQRFLGKAAMAYLHRKEHPQGETKSATTADGGTMPTAPPPDTPRSDEERQQSIRMIRTVPDTEVKYFASRLFPHIASDDRDITYLASRLLPHLIGPLSKDPALAPADFSVEALSFTDIEKLARRLYPAFSAKLKTELGRDRERAGMITGLHR